MEADQQVARATQRFGGSATEIKAEVVTDYVSFYGTALKKQGFELGYFDVFAGSGWTNTGSQEDNRSVALRVLEAPDPLAYYSFNDNKYANTISLQSSVDGLREQRARQGLLTPSTKITTQDGNQAIRDACAWVGASTRRRAVIFLDPFGMQVDWESMEAIARSSRLDVWALIPTGQAINRMLRRDGNIPPSWRARFDKFFGDPGWSERLYVPSRDLFGEDVPDRAAMEDIERYVMERLKSIFPPAGVHRTGLRLVRQSHPQFLLAFACANPNPAAYGLAFKAVDYLIKRALRP